MTETQRLRADGLADMFEEHGIVATREQIEAISEGFAYGLDMEREIEMNAHIPCRNPVCSKCISKDDIIKRLESDIEAYKAGVKRRHPSAVHVYVENGDVYYDLR